MKKNLPDVTLISVSSVDLDGTIYALWRSALKFKFKSIKLVSPIRPKKLPSWLSFEYTEDKNLLTSIDDYSHYCLYTLWKHVNSKFCLIIHADGYIIHPKKWSDEFMNWDYIGAPWRIKNDAYIDPFGVNQRVGNGGFSLRSKKVLEVPQKTQIIWNVNVDNFYNHMGANNLAEDGNICVHNRHIFEANGVRFAPLEVALKFSVEQKVPEYTGEKTFGFHKTLPNKRVYLLDKFWRSIFKITKLLWKN